MSKYQSRTLEYHGYTVKTGHTKGLGYYAHIFTPSGKMLLSSIRGLDSHDEAVLLAGVAVHQHQMTPKPLDELLAGD